MERIVGISVLFLSLLSIIHGLVIQSSWNHLKLKKVAPARVDGRLTGEVLLTCSATGSPAPTIAWYKDDLFVPHLEQHMGEEHPASIGETVASLRLSCLTFEDAGHYECRARAGVKEVTAVTEINIVPFHTNLCAETGGPEITMWRPTVMLQEGSTAVLPCRVKSHLKDWQVKWRNSEGVDVAGERFQVQDNGDLVISDLTFSDMGEYTCIASNLRGSQRITTFLYPLASSRPRL